MLLRETQEALRKVMPDESPIDLDEHARLIAQVVLLCRSQTQRADDLADALCQRIRETAR